MVTLELTVRTFPPSARVLSAFIVRFPESVNPAPRVVVVAIVFVNDKFCNPLVIVGIIVAVAVPPVIVSEDEPPPVSVAPAPIVKPPFIVSVVELPILNKQLAASVSEPAAVLLSVSDAPAVTPFVLLIVSVLKFVTLDGITSEVALPPNIRFDDVVVDISEGVPAILGPFRVSVVAATGNAPDVKVSWLLIVIFPAKVNPAELFAVKL